MKLTTNQSREFLLAFMREHFADTTFNQYIETALAGDFAYQMANAITQQDASRARMRADLYEAGARDMYNACYTNDRAPYDVLRAKLPEPVPALGEGAMDIVDLSQARRVVTQLRAQVLYLRAKYVRARGAMTRASDTAKAA